MAEDVIAFRKKNQFLQKQSLPLSFLKKKKLPLSADVSSLCFQHYD